MPNIAEYNAGNLHLQPTEVGIESATLAGRHIGAFYDQWAAGLRQLGEMAGKEIGGGIAAAGDAAMNYAGHQEISQGSAGLAGHIVKWTKDWNDLANNTDPNDPTIATKFRENLDNELDEFKSAFHTPMGKQWAEEHIDSFRQHMFEKTAADMSTRSGHAVVINQTQTANALATNAYNDPSQHTVDFSLQTLESSTKGLVSSSSMTPSDAAQVQDQLLQRGKERIINSAVKAAVEKTGVMPDWVKDPAYAPYIRPEELTQFEHEARLYKRMENSENRAEQQRVDYQARNDFNKAANEIESKTVPQNPGDRPTLYPGYWKDVKKVIAMDGARLESGRAAALIKNGDALTVRLNKPEPLGAISHDTTMGLLTQIRNGNVRTVDPIYDAYRDGKLNNSDFNMLKKEFSDLTSPDNQHLAKLKNDFLKAIASKIDSNLLGNGQMIDPDGKENFYKFSRELDRRMDIARRAGKDPYTLLDPNSPDYMGNPETLKQFQGPMRQTIQGLISNNGGVGAPRPSVNLTAPGNTITGTSVIAIPNGMSPAKAMEWLKQQGVKSGAPITLPDGTPGRAP